MTKAKRRIGTAIPAWIADKANQNRWNVQFIEILKRGYMNLDPTVSKILRDELLSRQCATKIRSYIDKGATAWFYEQARTKGAEHKKQLEITVAALGTVLDFCMKRGKQECLLHLGRLGNECSQELERCKQAYATKRHGRDRDHAILLECHSFLEVRLAQPVSFVTLANLVNAGYEADGNSPDVRVAEDKIRKNLANFKRNNPLWYIYKSKGKPPA